MVAKGIDQNIGQGDVAAARLGLRGLESNAVFGGFLQGFADLNDLRVEFDPRPAGARTSPSRIPVNSDTVANI